MKKIFIGMLLTLTVVFSAQAQPDRPGPRANERIQTYKIAFFTDKLQLTPEESQVFWPLFNEFEEKRNALRDKYELKGKRLELLGDDEVRELVMGHLKMEEELVALHRDYIMQFMDILPVRKVAMLQRVDNEFKRALLEEIQKRRQQNQPRRRN